MRKVLFLLSPIYFLKKMKKQNIYAYIFIMPALILYSTFFIYPFVSTLILSFQEWNGLTEKVFIGLSNFKRIFRDQLMLNSLSHNLIWLILGTVVTIFIGFILALLIWSGKTKGRIFFRTIYFMPVVLSPVIVGIVWRWMYNPNFGLLNWILEKIGLGFLSRGWLGDPKLALYMTIIAWIWSHIGYIVVIFLAGLQGVDMALHDAAKVDGANYSQEVIHVTIPQLKHIFTMITLFVMINCINVYDIIYVMTLGGPANSTELITTYIYKQAFRFGFLGYGAALSVIMTIILLAIVIFFYRVQSRSAD